ncbi:unnamed protein product [Ixodes hexagonus]
MIVYSGPLNFDFASSPPPPPSSPSPSRLPSLLFSIPLFSCFYKVDTEKPRFTDVSQHKGRGSYRRAISASNEYQLGRFFRTLDLSSSRFMLISFFSFSFLCSGIEYENCVMDCSQLRGVGDIKPDDPSNSERGSTPDTESRAEDHSPRDAAEPRPSPKSHEGHTLGSQDAPTAEHLTQLGSVGKLDSLRNSKEGVCGGSSPSPARYEAPSSVNKNPRKRGADDVGSRGSPKSSRPGSRSSLQPPSPARSLPAPEGFLARDGDADAASSTGGRPSSEGPGGEDSCDGPDGLSRPWKGGGQASSGEGLTVRELEDAMKKHLPEVRSAAARSAAIQWIGGPQSGAGGGPLPASTLLRQLYVNRESVIRSGSHVSAASRPTYYGDVPTPPEGPWTSPEAFVLPYAGYVEPPPPFSAVTPPSSVSPRDKQLGLAESPAFSEAAAVAAAAAMPHMRHYVSAADLPLKPQVLVHPGSLEYASPQEQPLYAGGFHLYGKPNGAWYSQQPNS